MQRFGLRYIILIIILSFFALIILLLQNRHPGGTVNIDLSKVPLSVGDWKAEKIPIDKETKDILETEAVLMRKYNKDGRSIWLSIVYYKDSRVALHLPESCSVGQGSYIVNKDKEKISIPSEKEFYANKLILKGDKGNQVIFYYFETGKLKTSSYQAMRWKNMLNKLKSKSNSSALIRFSALIEESPEKTAVLLKQFIKDISPLLSKNMFNTF